MAIDRAFFGHLGANYRKWFHQQIDRTQSHPQIVAHEILMPGAALQDF